MGGLKGARVVMGEGRRMPLRVGEHAAPLCMRQVTNL
jgi:hypothetical protein